MREEGRPRESTCYTAEVIDICFGQSGTEDWLQSRDLLRLALQVSGELPHIVSQLWVHDCESSGQRMQVCSRLQLLKYTISARLAGMSLSPMPFARSGYHSLPL